MHRKHAVFVYGTLKQGLSNHFFLREARFLGRAQTAERYALYEDEIPIVTRSQAVSPIQGEVYEVSEKTLHHLDVLEQHPAFYRREQVEVVLEDGARLEAWLYFSPEPKGALLPEGVWPRPVEPGEF